MKFEYKTLVGIAIGLGIGIVIMTFFVFYNKTLGATEYIEIDKSEENLKISKTFDLSDKQEENKTKKEKQIEKTKKNKEEKEENKESEVKKEIEPSFYEMKLKELKSLETFALNKRSDLFHIALLGLDSRQKENLNSRTDAIVILTIDKNKSEIRLTSIPRDLLIIRNGKLDKITHAYLYGRGENTLKVLNNNFGLDIKEFATINMFELEEILKFFAPLKMKITEQEKEEINYRIKEFAGIKIGSDEWFLEYSDKEFSEINSNLLKGFGEVDLNAQQLIAYLRIRKTDSAYARSDRHKEVINKIINKISDLSIVELANISKKVFPKVTTSLTQEQLLKLVKENINVLPTISIKSKIYPMGNNLKSVYINGIYYTDIKDRIKMVKGINNYIQGE